MCNYRYLSTLVAGIGLAACGGSPSPAPAAAPTAAETPAAATFAAQAARGAELYAASCAKCHGADGSGSDKAPPLVGLADGALPMDPPPGAQARNVQFRTALDVFTWVKANMPPNAGGSLADADYVAILAFDLRANGVELSAPLDAQSAAALVLHPAE